MSQPGRGALRQALDRLLDLAFLAAYVRDPSVSQRQWLLEQVIDTVTFLGFECDLSIGKLNQKDIIKTTKMFWRSLGGRSTRRLSKSDSYRGSLAPRALDTPLFVEP